jgi:indolepyruvate decarboxylase
MSTVYTVGDYLVERLQQLGLEHLFSIAGDYSIDWVTDCVQPSGIKVIQEVNELCAGYAADGYARLKGIGALCVTYSAGALSAVNAIAGAYTERVPVVLINGTPSIKRTLTYEQTGFSSHHFISGRQTNLQVFQYITAACVRLDSADQAPRRIDDALTECITKRCPVYIELLQDVSELRCTRPQGRLEAARYVSDADSLNKSWELIKKGLLEAERPLIWLGVEIDRFGLRDKARQVIDHLNIPFVTQLLSKAVLSEDHQLFAGVFDGQASSPDVQALATESDFVLALGIWLTDINTLGWAPADRRPDFDKTAFASLDAVKYGTYFGAQVTLDDLMDRLLEVEPRKTPKFTKPGVQAFSGNAEDPVSYQGFYDFIQPYIDKDTIIGSDASLNYFGSMLLKVGATGGYVAQSSYSSIGYIAPAATGLCLARENSERQKVMVFTGDGGFQMSLQCVSTQTRFGLNAIIFVIDNGVFGVEQWLHNAWASSPDNPKGEFSRECLVHPWNYSELSKVFTSNGLECVAWKVGTYGALKEAIERAIANHTGPSIIQVVVPAKSDLRNEKWKEKLDKAKEGN